MVVYSRELRRLTLFYLPKPHDRLRFETLYASIHRKKAPEIVLPGVVVSSLRPIRVYIKYSLYNRLKKSQAYVIVRATSNASLHVSDPEIVVNVNDTQRLSALTGVRKVAKLPLRLLYMIKDRETKIEPADPEAVAELILKGKPVYVRTVWTSLLDILLYKKTPAVGTIAMLIVGDNELKIWSIPQLNPVEYLPLDTIRERLFIPRELLNRIIRYDPASNILLIVQPLQSIKLADIRKMLYRRPRLPLTLDEVAEALRARIGNIVEELEE